MSGSLAKPDAHGITLPSVFKHVTMISGARILGAGLTFIAQIVLANWLGAETLGLYFQAVSIAAILAIIACLGLPSVTVRFISCYRTTDRHYDVYRFVRASRCFAFVGMALAIVASVASVNWLAPKTDQTALLIGIAIAIPLAMMRLNGAVANAHRQFQTGYLPDLLGRPATVFAIALIVPLVGIGGSVELILALHLFAAFGLALWQYQRIETNFSTSKNAENAENDEACPEIKPRLWLSAGLPLVPVALLTSAFADVMIIVTSPLMAKADLAIFAVCLKLALLAGFSIQLVYQILLPDMVEAYASGRIDELKRNLAHANLIAVILSVVVAIMFFLVGDEMLAIFGPEFIAGKWCLLILSLSLIAKAALGPASHILVVAGREKLAVAAAFIAVVTLVSTSLVAVPVWGMMGASLSALVVSVIWSGIQTWMAWKHTGILTIGMFGLTRQ